MSEAVAVPSLMMMMSVIVSEESLVREIHTDRQTHTHRQTWVSSMFTFSSHKRLRKQQKEKLKTKSCTVFIKLKDTAVVVHLENASLTNGTVMCAWRFWRYALLADRHHLGHILKITIHISILTFTPLTPMQIKPVEIFSLSTHSFKVLTWAQ